MTQETIWQCGEGSGVCTGELMRGLRTGVQVSDEKRRGEDGAVPTDRRGNDQQTDNRETHAKTCFHMTCQSWTLDPGDCADYTYLWPIFQRWASSVENGWKNRRTDALFVLALSQDSFTRSNNATLLKGKKSIERQKYSRDRKNTSWVSKNRNPLERPFGSSSRLFQHLRGRKLKASSHKLQQRFVFRCLSWTLPTETLLSETVPRLIESTPVLSPCLLQDVYCIWAWLLFHRGHTLSCCSWHKALKQSQCLES